jgi:hypothetical protein
MYDPLSDADITIILGTLLVDAALLTGKAGPDFNLI